MVKSREEVLKNTHLIKTTASTTLGARQKYSTI